MGYSAFSAKVVSIVSRILLGLLFGSLVVGQFGRIVLSGQGGGILISDVAVTLFLVGAGICLLLGFMRQKNSRNMLALPSVLPFLGWSVAVLIARSGSMQYDQLSIAVFYWLRLASILLLYPAGMVIMSTEGTKYYAKQVFIYAYAALVALGFIQLLLFPNLEGLGGGWDPHMGRMVATWLDPNFFGAFLALALPAILSWMRLPDILRLVFFVTSFVAILLTKSRSTYIAGAIALCVCGVVWLFSAKLSREWKKIVIPLLVTIFILCGFAGVLLQERATQIFIHDPTIVLRIEAYRAVWERLVEPNIIFGVGYNAYQIEAQKAGLISNFLIHSRSGSDSSILTLLVTTGIVGTALFLIPMLSGLVWHRSLLFTWATVFLLVHSQFENSLLYPHLLIPYILIAILALR